MAWFVVNVIFKSSHSSNVVGIASNDGIRSSAVSLLKEPLIANIGSAKCFLSTVEYNQINNTLAYIYLIFQRCLKLE